MAIHLLGMDTHYANFPICGLPLSAHVRRLAETLTFPQGTSLYLMADAPCLTKGLLEKALRAEKSVQIGPAALVVIRQHERSDLSQARDIEECANILRGQGVAVEPIDAHADYTQRVTDNVLLAQAMSRIRTGINETLMRSGVVMIDPASAYIDAAVRIGAGTLLHPNCTLTGSTVIGNDCVLLPGCRLQNATVADRVTLESAVVLDASVGAGTTVGPFAYLRPGCRIGAGCRIGDFVEVKNSNIGDGTKVSHLTYVGDSDLGKDVNLGCGVVFVNYDGKKKSRTTVGDHAFIGCNVNLVSPVDVGAEAYIAAGSTVTQDVPSGAFSIARSRQTTKEGWVSQRKDQGKL